MDPKVALSSRSLAVPLQEKQNGDKCKGISTKIKCECGFILEQIRSRKQKDETRLNSVVLNVTKAGKIN